MVTPSYAAQREVEAPARLFAQVTSNVATNVVLGLWVIAEVIRDRQRFTYCIRTEVVYLDWIKRYIRHFGKRGGCLPLAT